MSLPNLCPVHNLPLDTEPDCPICGGIGELENEAEGDAYVTCWGCKGTGTGQILVCEECLVEELTQ